MTLAERRPTRAQLHAQITVLEQAVQDSDLLGQAKGLIRLLCHCSESASREILDRVSRQTHRPAADVARILTESCASGTVLPSDISASWGPYLRAAGPSGRFTDDAHGLTGPDISSG